jgi:hypothetical protein
MTFFSNEIASVLQFFTFPLEVVGLTLATIEMRFPLIASRINRYFLEEGSYQEAMSQNSILGALLQPEVPPVGPLRHLSRSQMRTFAISVVGTIICAFLLTAFFMLKQGHYIPAVITLVALPLMIPITYITVAVSHRLYRFVNTWVPGRTVGTLGITLASVGVLGEAYQFAAQLVI